MWISVLFFGFCVCKWSVVIESIVFMRNVLLLNVNFGIFICYILCVVGDFVCKVWYVLVVYWCSRCSFMRWLICIFVCDMCGKEGWIIRGVIVIGDGEGCVKYGFGVCGMFNVGVGVIGCGGLLGRLRDGVGVGVSLL